MADGMTDGGFPFVSSTSSFLYWSRGGKREEKCRKRFLMFWEPITVIRSPFTEVKPGRAGLVLGWVTASKCSLPWATIFSHELGSWSSTRCLFCVRWLFVFSGMSRKIRLWQSSNFARWGKKGEGEKEGANIHKCCTKPQCCSDLQQLWNYMVRMLTNWASWIDTVVACWGEMVGLIAAESSTDFPTIWKGIQRNILICF